MSNIDYFSFKECPSCGENWVIKEFDDGTFHSALCGESESDYKGAENCYRCPHCRTAFPREVYVHPTEQHTHTPFLSGPG